MAKNHERPTYIVGIGGSAGGLEAFEQFISAVPPDTGMAFVVVQHLDPNYKAKLPELLQRGTALPVLQVEDGMAVEPNHIYVIPPNKDLSILDGAFQLIDPAGPRGLRLPIDFFFRQLAADQGDKAVGIILSGMGSDGSSGLKAIKEKMGMTMAQIPESAKFDGMPRSAVDTGLVDYILTPAEMPARLVEYSRHITVAVRKEPAPLAEKTSTAIQKVLLLLRAYTKHDFSLYKRDMIYRRIKRRMSVHLIENTGDYLRYLQENPHELELLFRELLIGVTNFFRDSEAFDALKEQLIAHVVKPREIGSTLRAWIVGCSTGEEAYSIAMLLSECLDSLEGRGGFDIQIFATDIDKEAVDAARRGVYKSNITADVSPERLKRFFVRDEDTYRLKREIREMVVFAPHDIISDPPFTKMDIVSCRNLLIYFSAELQKRVLPILHYSLNPGGILFLGTSEGTGGMREMFSSLDNKHKVFQRKLLVGKAAPLYLPPLRALAATGGQVVVHEEAEVAAPTLVQQLLLESFAPPAALVNENGDILFISGRTGKYLEPSPGKANLNIHAMAREGLKYELAGVIQRVAREKSEAVIKNIKVKTNGDHWQIVNVTITPVHEPHGSGDLALVVFQDVETPKPVRSRVSKTAAGRSAALAEMEQELARTKERLEATIRQAEAVQEENQSTNEEFQSANEELQSTNEELMTSKEEMQSLNEELITVNAELQSKVDELSRSNSDMNNLLNSTEIATIFLDADLRIRRFTPHMADIFNMIESDIGRPITDLASSLYYDDLAVDATRVLETLASKEVRVSSGDGRRLVLRIMPYVTTDKVVDGVVITISDITASLKESLKAEEGFARNVVDAVREALLVLDARLTVVTANPSFYRIFDVAPESTEGRRVYGLGGGQWNIPALRELLEDILPGKTEFNGFPVEHDFPGIGRKSMLLNARRIKREDGEDFILLAIEDVTGHHQA